MNAALVNWAALIGVDYFGLSVFRKGFFQRGDSIFGFKRDRHPMRQHATTCPVDHRSQIDKGARHRDVRCVERRDFVAALDLPVAQQVRPDLVGRVFATRVRLAI